LLRNFLPNYLNFVQNNGNVPGFKEGT
jgi:hypothetical protein